MNIIKTIIADYENLIKTTIQIPLDNGDLIKFSFRPQDLPHLLGLQHLVDNPYLFEYNQKRLSATELYRRMCSKTEDAIDVDEFEKSRYFQNLYDGRIKYFSSKLILDIISAKQIVKFDPSKVKNFSTKLEKVQYMFWKKYEDVDHNYGYFGVGFMTSGNKSDENYPNTFFFRMDDDYIRMQKMVLPYSLLKKDKKGNVEFNIYWDEIRFDLRKNNHYKKLLKEHSLQNGELDWNQIKDCREKECRKHFELLKLDALNVIYLPYMDQAFRWTNEEKRYILELMESQKKNFLPEDIKMLLNVYRQKHSLKEQ